MEQEIILIVGFPASGKSTLANQFKNYTHLNRDTVGGSIKGLAVRLQERIDTGLKSFVIDNTFPTVESRSHFIAVAKRNNLSVRCLWLKTSCEDAQLNASLRMIKKYGRILDLPEITKNSKEDPGCFPAAPLFTYRKQFEEPTLNEGFSRIESIKFKREWPKDYVNRALIVDYDETLRTTKSGNKYPTNLDDIKILPGRLKLLNEYLEKGYILTGVSNQSWVGKGDLTWDQANEGFQHTNHLLGLDIDYRFCPHKVPPIMCHCRKPQTGLGAELIEKYKLNPSQCFFIGDATTDKTFAERCGFQFIHTGKFFQNGENLNESNQLG